MKSLLKTEDFRCCLEVLKQKTITTKHMENKQTLEEAAEKWNEQQTTLEFGKPHNAPNRIKAFIAGAKWQQEQSTHIVESNKMVTAVEWLFKQLWEEPKDKMVWYAILDKAKEMEKTQIMNAYEFGVGDAYDYTSEEGELFYNEIYGK